MFTSCQCLLEWCSMLGWWLSPAVTTATSGSMQASPTLLRSHGLLSVHHLTNWYPGLGSWWWSDDACDYLQVQQKEHMKAWFSKDINRNPTYIDWVSYKQFCSFCADRVTCQLMNFNRLGSSANWQIRIENWLPQFSHYAGEKLNLKWLMLFIFKLKSKTLLTDLPKISGWNYFNLHPWQIWLN